MAWARVCTRVMGCVPGTALCECVPILVINLLIRILMFGQFTFSGPIFERFCSIKYLPPDAVFRGIFPPLMFDPRIQANAQQEQFIRHNYKNCFCSLLFVVCGLCRQLFEDT